MSPQEELLEQKVNLIYVVTQDFHVLNSNCKICRSSFAHALVCLCSKLSRKMGPSVHWKTSVFTVPNGVEPMYFFFALFFKIRVKFFSSF